MAFHLLVSSRICSSDSSTSVAVSPNSLALIMYSGWRISSATGSVLVRHDKMIMRLDERTRFRCECFPNARFSA